MKISLGTSDWSRSVAGESDLVLKNRYYEHDPLNYTDEQQVALISRPALRDWVDGQGTGPIRQIYSQPGAFDDAMFFVTGNSVRKMATDGSTITTLGTIGTTDGDVSMTATDAFLFLCDGSALYYYTEDDFARGTLTLTGTISADETVTIGSTVYKFASDLTPDADGSSSNPWLVALGLTAAASLQNLYDAIGGTGVAGTTYSAALAPDFDVAPVSVSDTVLVIRAAINGTDGNSIATTETLANGSWGAATLAGGGGSGFNTVAVPDDDGIISVGAIANFVICVVAPGFGKNGRFYWIEPGESTIDALNFATAERSPDPAWQVEVVADHFLLPGSSSIEDWYPSGDALAPFIRQQGILPDQGIWPGTIWNNHKGAVILVGNDGVPYRAEGGQVTPIGTPGIVQRIREAISTQKNG